MYTKFLTENDKERYSFVDIVAVKKREKLNKCALGKQVVQSGDGPDRIRTEVTVANGF
jgi:hypothetical protein